MASLVDEFVDLVRQKEIPSFKLQKLPFATVDVSGKLNIRNVLLTPDEAKALAAWINQYYLDSDIKA